MKTRILFFLLICSSSFSTLAQSSDRVIKMYEKMNTHIDKMETKGEDLFFMYCDVIAEGHIQKYGIVNLKKVAKYNFFIEVTDDVIDAEFVLLDSTEAVIKKAIIKGGQKREFSVIGYDGLALIGMKGLKFQENRLLGFYGLSITNLPFKPTKDTKLKVIDNTPSTGSEVEVVTINSEEFLTEGCFFEGLEGLKFKTTKQYTQTGDEAKKWKKNYKSSIVINKAISKVTQKVRRKKDVYTVIKKGCTSGGTLKLIVENENSYRFVMTIDKNRNIFKIQPDGSNKSTIYDMTKIKN